MIDNIVESSAAETIQGFYSNRLEHQDGSQLSEFSPQRILNAATELSVVGETPSFPEVRSKKYIIYLEPEQDSLFYKRIVDFFVESGRLRGPNEAQMYHPHCSITGFFDLPCDGTDFFWQDKVIEFWDRYIQQRNSSEVPIVTNFYIRSNPTSLSMKLEPPLYLRNSVQTFKNELQPLVYHHLSHNYDISEEKLSVTNVFTLRPKPIDHISLAYTRPNTLLVPNKSGHELAPEISQDDLSNLTMLANDMNLLALSESVKWHVIFYEVLYKSTTISERHVFKELKKWNI